MKRPDIISVKFELYCFKASSLVNVFVFGVNNILHFVLDGHFHNVGSTILQIVLRWFSSIPESIMPLADDGHTAWIHYFWTSNQFQHLYQNVCHGQEWKHALLVFLCYLPIDFTDQEQITQRLKEQEFLFLHMTPYMPYLTLWDKKSQNLAHLEAISRKIFQISHNFQTNLQHILRRNKHKSHFVVVITSFLHLNTGFWLFWGSSKMIFVKISQNFIECPLKICLISQISVHSLWHVCDTHCDKLSSHVTFH